MKPVIIIAIAVVFGIGIGLSLNVSAEEGLIPSWIKNIALMFGQDQISDSEFIGALQYLVKEGILVIPSEQHEKIDTSQLTVQELKEQAVSWNYKDILRNEEDYIGKIIFLTGEIKHIEKSEKNEGWVLLSVYTAKLEYTSSWIEDLIYVWYDGGRLLDYDVIEAYIVIDAVLEREIMMDNYYAYNPIGTAKHVTCTNC